MIYDTDGQCYIARNQTDFEGWTVLGVMRFKPDICVVACRRVAAHPRVGTMEFRSVFARDADVPRWVPE
jgi:hypothetical protein